MLPREHRLGAAADFAAVIKGGRRAGTSRLAVHVLISDQLRPPRAGFVVSKKVGNSVVRHRVTRRLRPLMVEQLRGLGAGTAVVVRALPSAAEATSAELRSDLRTGVGAAVRKARSQPKSAAATPSTARSVAKIAPTPKVAAEGGTS